MALVRSWRRIPTLVVIALVALAPEAGAHEPVAPDDYHWVRPPATVVDPGSPAQAASATFEAALFAGGRAFAWTPDLQATLEIVVADGGAAGPAEIGITPLDPDALEPLPNTVLSNGNAHRVEATTPGWSAALTTRLVTPYPVESVWRLDETAMEWETVTWSLASTGEVEISLPVGTEDAVLVAARSAESHPWWERMIDRPVPTVLILVALVTTSVLVTPRRVRVRQLT